MNQPDDNEDEAVSKELDEQIRKSREEIFKATVDEAQEQQASASETQSQFDFNPDEVDYTGDDEDMEEEVDVEVEEEVEEEVDPEQAQADQETRQENESLPAWTLNLDSSARKMPTIGLQNVDMEDRAAQIFDNALMAKILQMFPFYYNQRVVMSPKDYYDKMVKNEIGRESLRAWLRKFVSNDIFTWQDLTEEAVYQGVASNSSQINRQRKERVVKVALWLILVHEFGAQEEVQPSRIAACVKAAATAGHKLKQLWAVPLLFLAASLGGK
eukprot:s2456_g1.t1